MLAFKWSRHGCAFYVHGCLTKSLRYLRCVRFEVGKESANINFSASSIDYPATATARPLSRGRGCCSFSFKKKLSKEQRLLFAAQNSTTCRGLLGEYILPRIVVVPIVMMTMVIELSHVSLFLCSGSYAIASRRCRRPHRGR